MNISSISNNTFGHFVAWNTWDNVVLNRKEIDILNMSKDIINRTKGNEIDVWARVGTPNPDEPDKLYIKLKTMPINNDMFFLQKFRPEVTRETYKRHSKWMPLDESFLYNAIMYLHKQIGYIRYCKNDPNHNVNFKDGYGIPRF